MRFWITRNSELPIKEQLVRQVVLGILSDDLPAGHRLPSVRALARRHKIHPNTVSAAYHDLLDRGWLALRRGSGVYVQPMAPAAANSGSGIDGLLATLLRDARGLGLEPEQVLDRMEQLLRPRQFQRILIAEPEPAMREILLAEIEGHVRSAGTFDTEPLDGAAVAALTSRSAAVRKRLPRATPCVTLRLNSVRKSLEGETRPSRDAILSIASKSFEFRSWARTMLLAVGLEPEGVCEVDANAEGWTRRLGASSIVIADLVSARSLSAGARVKIFRVIAEASLEELKQLCPL